MRAVKRWRYYCDYCKKVGGNKFYIENHEKGCTGNINRVCRMCAMAGWEQPDIKKMISIVKSAVVTLHNPYLVEPEYDGFADGKNEENVLAELKKITTCPACILTALRHSRYSYLFPLFDYKEERRDFWEEINYENGNYR